MADEANESEVQINVKGPNELKLQITIRKDKTVLELKQAIAAKSDVEADRQRLIYSGRVLKDEDTIAVYKIQSSHTIHMVKGVSRAGASSANQSQPLPAMQAGQNPNDPLTQLNSHQGYGLMAGLNPFNEMGLNSNDPNLMLTMMNSPQFLQQLSSVMSNPAVLDQIIASNPQLAAMAPQVREVFQSENFRQLMSNPESLRTMMQMASMFREPGGSPFGAPGGFAAPGVPSTANPSSTAAPPSGQTPSTIPTATPGIVPIGAPGNAAGMGTMPQFNPALLQQLLGGGMGNFGPMGGSFTPAPTDSRPVEERFQVQLQQLQEMGFTDASQNIRALLATGGNVHSAVEYILSGNAV